MKPVIGIDGRGMGYIRLYRKLLGNPLFTDKPAAWFKIWVYILLSANWQASVFRPRQGEEITVPAGSLITSLEKLGTHAGLSKEHARRCLDYLERTQMVTLVRTHHWTMVTVVNWATYQASDEGAEHTGHHAGHHSDSRGATHDPPHAATPSKEVKNSRKKYKSNSRELDTARARSSPRRSCTEHRVDPAVEAWFVDEFWPLYPRHEGRLKALQAAGAKADTRNSVPITSSV